MAKSIKLEVFNFTFSVVKVKYTLNRKTLSVATVSTLKIFWPQCVCYSDPAMQCKEEEPYKEPIPILWITLAKGQLFSKCLFGVIVSTKKATKILKGFLP